jgi:hypothetical protein
MKKNFLSAIASLGLALFTQAQQPFANRNLSNLLSPTAVNQDLLPNVTNARNLGSSSLNWKDLYLGGSIFKGSLRFLSNEGTQNTFLGISSGIAITTGSNNTAIGYQALLSNTTGERNTAIGASALTSNTTGSSNIAVGVNVLANNTIGGTNIAVGNSALLNNTTGSDNMAIGTSAMELNITGSNNIAIGNYALVSGINGFGNTAIGMNTLNVATSSFNTATGFVALARTTSGQLNTANGALALHENTIGSENTAVGYEAMFFNKTGERNTAMGVKAILDNTEGSDNTGIGWQALRSNTGGGNTAIGHGAGKNFHTSNCTFLGTLAESLGQFANSTAIGYQATFTATDQVRVGNSSVTSIGGFADWTNFSDGRYKKNVKEDVPGLEFITQLKPITYTLDIEGLEKTMKANAPQMNTGAVQPELSQLEIAAKKARAKEIHTGFAAQEVEAAAKKLNYSFNGVDAPKNDKDFYGLRYAEFVVPLVKAVQELDAENKKMKEEMKELRQLILNLMNSNTNNSSPRISGAYLEQNAPNPFNSTTIIRCNVPMESASARIVITDMKGQLVKTIAVNSKGKNQITLSGGELAAGSYVYSLWVDDKQVDSKRMILTK